MKAGSHVVGTPTSIPEGKEGSERTFSNPVKSTYKATATITFGGETLRMFSLKSLCGQEQIKDAHHNCFHLGVYETAEPV